MTQAAGDELSAFLHAGDQAIWSAAALVLAVQGAASVSSDRPPRRY